MEKFKGKYIKGLRVSYAGILVLIPACVFLFFVQAGLRIFWIVTDAFSDLVFVFDIAVQFRTGYLEQGLMVYKTKKLAKHYIGSRAFYLDFSSLVPTDLFQLYLGSNPMLRLVTFFFHLFLALS